MIRQFCIIIKNSCQNFLKNEDILKSAALSFYSFTSIVPFCAIIFAAAASLGLEDYLEEQVRETFKFQEEIIKYVIQFSRALIMNTKSSLIGVIGFLFLLCTSFSLLIMIEDVLNQIFKIFNSRSLIRKIIVYPVLLTFCSAIFFATSGLNIFLASYLNVFSGQDPVIQTLSPLFLILIKSIPFLTSISLFIVIYLFIPNSSFKPISRIVVAIIIGIFFQIWQWAYIIFQERISSYGAIYGAFAAIPLFLLWMQISWCILLAGAEIASTIENNRNKFFDTNL